MQNFYVYISSFKRLLFIFLFLFTPSYTFASDYYWVGGGGTWDNHDITHWSKYSGGTDTNGVRHRYKIPPNSTDNVFFDANSGFTIDDNEIIVNGTVSCKNMTWDDAPNMPVIRYDNVRGNVLLSGSLVLQKNMYWGTEQGYKGVGIQCYSSTDNTITTNGLVLPRIDLIFEGIGSWTLLDDFTSRATINLQKGKFNTNGYNVSLDTFTTVYSKDVRDISFENSTVELYGRLNIFYSDNLSFKTTNSHIICKPYEGNDFSINFPKGFRFNELTFIASTLESICEFRIQNTGNSGADEIEIDKFIIRGDSGLKGLFNVREFYLKEGSRLDMTGAINSYNQLVVTELFEAVGDICANKAIKIENTSYKYTKAILTIEPGATVNTKGLKFKNINSEYKLEVNNSIDLGGNSNIVFLSNSINNTFYWIGGGGQWGDKSHWTTNADGIPLNVEDQCLPKLDNDVVFNKNSGFNANDTVMITTDAFCNDMKWQGALNSPVITVPWVNQPEHNTMPVLYVKGSIEFQRNMNYQVYETSLLSNDSDETIHTNGLVIGDAERFNNYIFSFEADGSWAISDDFKAINGSILQNKGTLDTKGHNLTLNSIVSSSEDTRNLLIDNSKIVVQELSIYSGKNNTLNLSAINSRIIMQPITSAYSHFSSVGGFEYNEVIFEDNILNADFTPSDIKEDVYSRISIPENSSTRFRNLLSKANLKLTEAKINADILTLLGNEYEFGDRHEPIIINDKLTIKGESCKEKTWLNGSDYNGGTSIITSSNTVIDVSNVVAKNLKAQLPLTFKSSIDFGNNENIIFEQQAEETYYWVGGSGEWKDTRHWSYEDGGAFPATDVNCPPSPNTNIIFNSNSGFSSNNNVVKVEEDALCKDMVWDNAKANPVLELGAKLYVNGDVSLQRELYITGEVKKIIFKSKEDEILHLKMNGCVLGRDILEGGGNSNYNTFTKLIFQGQGQHVLDDDMVEGPLVSILLTNGVLNLNSRTLDLLSFKANSIKPKIYLENTTFNMGKVIKNSYYSNWLEWRIDDSSTEIFGGESCTINFIQRENEDKYYNFSSQNQKIGVVSTNQRGTIYSSTVGTLKLGGNTIFNTYRSVAKIDTLQVNPNIAITLQRDTDIEVLEKAYLSGSPCNKVTINGNISNNEATIINILNGGAEFINVSMREVKAINPITLKLSEDNGENENVTFTPWTPESFEFIGLGSDKPNATYPYTISTDGFYITPDAKIEWNDGTNSDTLVVTEAGAYDVKVTYSDGCVLRDQILIGNFKAQPDLDCIRIGDNYISGEGYAGGVISLTTNGEQYTVTVNDNGKWSIALKKDLIVGQELILSQSLNGFDGDPLIYTVTVESGEPRVPEGIAYNTPNGSIKIDEQIGYEYSLNGGSYTTNPIFTNLSTGTYTVTARLINFPECTSQAVFNLGVDNLPTVDCIRATDTQITGAGMQGAIISIYLSNGATYSTVVSNDDTWDVVGVSSLGAGEVVTITQTILPYQASRPIQIKIAAEDEPHNPKVTTVNAPNGSIILEENENYEYQLNDGQFTTTSIFKNLEEGSYELTVRLKESPGCTNFQEVEILSNIPQIRPSQLTLCTNYSDKLISSIDGGRWFSEDPSIANVDEVSGLVTAISQGTTTITYKTELGYEGYSKVVVNEGTTDPIVLDPEPPTCVILGDTYTYTLPKPSIEVEKLPYWLKLIGGGEAELTQVVNNLSLDFKILRYFDKQVVDSKGNVFIPAYTASGTVVLVKISPDGIGSLYAGTLVADVQNQEGERDGSLDQSVLSVIQFITIDNEDNIFISQESSGNIKKINTTTKMLTTFASPEESYGLTTDVYGNIYYIGYIGGTFGIKKVSKNGVMSDYITGLNVAGYGISIDKNGDFYIADIATGVSKIVKVKTDGTITTIAGGMSSGYVDGFGEQAQFNLPTTLIMSDSGDIYVTDNNMSEQSIVRKISKEGQVSTLDGIAPSELPSAISINKNNVFIAQQNNVNGEAKLSIFKLSEGSGIISSTEIPNEGVYTYTLSINHECGRTVKEVEINVGGPQFTTCPDDILVNVADGVTATDVSWTEPIAIDACGDNVTLTATHNSGSSFNAGEVTTITYTATDKNNNTSKCSFTVQVEKESAENCMITASSTALYVDDELKLIGTPEGGTWSVDDTAILSVNSSGIIMGLSSGTTTVTYSVGSCATSRSINVMNKNSHVIDEPAPLEVCITAPSTPICSEKITTLTVKVTGGTPSYTITYNGNATTLTNAAGDGETPTASYELTTGALATTTVFDGRNIIVSDANGCAVSYVCTATVEVKPTPDDSFVLEDVLACPSSLVTLTLSGSEVGVNYQLQTVTPTANVGNPIPGNGTPLFFVVNSGTNSETYQVVASNDNASNCTVVLNAVAVVEIINTATTINLNDENVVICKLPQRILNLNEYITYSPTATHDIEWFNAIDMMPINGKSFNTDLLTVNNVSDFVYRVTEEICGNEIKGTGHLYIKTEIADDGQLSKTATFCYSDAENINLNVLKEFESVGTWKLLNIPTNTAQNYLKGYRFDGKKVFEDGVGVNNEGIGIYNFEFTATQATDCISRDDKINITIIITN